MSCNLVTGGFGFIGGYLARHLLEKGENVVIFDIAGGSKLMDNFKGQFKAVQGDLTNWSQVFETVRTNKVDTIYHLGSLLPPQSEENLWRTYQVNVTGTLNILETARLLAVANLIYVSSIGTYRLDKRLVVDEDVVQRPPTMYGTSKLCSERLGEQYHRKHGVNFRALRFPPVIGAGRTGAQASTYSCRMIEEPALGRPYSVSVTPETQIPALYVKDAVRSLVGLKEASEAQLKRRVYNMHGFLATASELANAVVKQIPLAEITFKPDRDNIIRFEGWPERMDDTRARDEWGWEPQYDFDRAIEDFIAEIKANWAIFT